jgi:hypothetical protein
MAKTTPRVMEEPPMIDEPDVMEVHAPFAPFI